MAGAEDDQEQSLVGHLVELRKRLLRAVIGVLVLVIGLLPFSAELYRILALPMMRNFAEGAQMIATNPISPFFTPLKLTAFTGLVLAAPWVLYQLWAFIAPGLYRHERRLAVPLLVSATLLFYLGCAFAYFLVLPTVSAFVLQVAPEGVAIMTDISEYLDFVLVVFLAFGVAFEVPVATVIVVAMGWATIEQLREARPYVIVGAFIVAALITPPDVISQLMLAIPMALLYEVGIVASRFVLNREIPEHERR